MAQHLMCRVLPKADELQSAQAKAASSTLGPSFKMLTRETLAYRPHRSVIAGSKEMKNSCSSMDADTAMSKISERTPPYAPIEALC